MTTAPASFVDGQYRIRAGLDRRSAAVAAVHEEAHGIIRRSTLYGLLLSRIGVLGPPMSPADSPIAHALYSRGRTSEEIYATFASIEQAIWAGYADALETELGNAAEYRYYFDLGHELMRDIVWPYARIAVLEGVVRFCWSSSHVADALTQATSWTGLQSMPTLAWPDARWSRLRKDWPELGGASLQAALLARFPLLGSLSQQSHGESIDPLHGVKQELKDRSVLMVDTGPELTALANRQSMALAMLGESMACFVADHLAQMYAGTAMAAPSTAEVYRFIEQRRSSASMKRLNLIENVENLGRRRRALVESQLDWDRDWEKPIIGVRSWLSFATNFEIPAELRASRRDGDEAIYATAFSLDARQRRNPPSAADLPLALLPGGEGTPAPALVDWIPPPTIIAVWSSTVLQDIETWLMHFHVMARARYKVWIVADTDPRELVLALRFLIGEVNGFIHNPGRSAAGSAALVMRSLDDPTKEQDPQVLRGIIFPGLGHTLKIIVDMLRLTLDDDFRGMSMFDIHPASAQKRTEGQALVEWLILNEHVFGYSRPS